jgi:hypothetical protein
MKASNRMRIGHALVAGFAFLAITLGNSVAVRAQVILSDFSSAQSADYVYTGGTTSSTLTTSPSPLTGTVTWTNFFTGSNLAATITLSGVHSSTAVAAGSNQQTNWIGSYTINQGANVYTVTFTGAILTIAGDSATLGGDATITKNFGSAIGAPMSFSLSLTGLSPQPTVGPHPFGFQNFTANDTQDTSGVVTGVPEPSTLAIAGLGALGMIGYGLRRRKALGA